MLLKEEVQWRQKSRIKWIKEGDCNSKFFHRMATGRSRKFIKSLIFERGVTLSNIEDISKEIVNFFGKLYSKPKGASWRIEGVDWVIILGESAVWLDRPFSEEEVQMTVFQLNKEKAPGSDGFTIAVYQKCWGFLFVFSYCWVFLCCSDCVGRTSHPSSGFLCFFFLFFLLYLSFY